MGNCVTVHKSREPAKRVGCSIQGDRSVQTESSIRKRGVNGHLHKAGIGSMPPRNSGNPEEMFFDSHGWLDSDCEDFVSVGGDFTPSQGCSPVHTSFRELLPPPPPGNESSSPADPKRQLIELLCESFRSDQPADGDYRQLNLQEKVDAKLITFYLSPKHAYGSPCNEPTTASPICLSETTPNAFSNPDINEREKTGISTHRCLPNLLRNLSSSDRKKRLSHANGGGR